jgi:hypothetical protein
MFFQFKLSKFVITSSFLNFGFFITAQIPEFNTALSDYLFEGYKNRLPYRINDALIHL